MIDPKNGRCFIDIIEQLLRQISNVASIIDKKPYIINGIAQFLTNNESTCGYKQHMLESEDDGRYVDTYLNSYRDNGIEFQTPSGRSTTDYTSGKLHRGHDEH
jgi:hypothetical protein